MRIQFLIPLVALLAACTTNAPRMTSLTPDKAGALAQQLANEEAHALYGREPFRKAEAAEFRNDHWTWRQIQGEGNGDLEAKVEFKADGTHPKVSITRLQNVLILP